MKKCVLLLIFAILSAQNLPDVWSQSYCTYDMAEVCDPGKYILGFGVDNFALYTDDPDSVSYDERRFDIFARLGILRNTELEIKYSSPTCGVVSGKYQFIDSYISGAFKLGLGYMKGTRVGMITDYVFDFYPTFILGKNFSRNVGFFLAPKIIYSTHIKDRQEHSNREPRHVFQYGFAVGMAFGDRFAVLLESNWLFGNNMGVEYTVNQFGIGVNLKINPK